MADTDQIAIIRLGPGDALAGLALSAEAQWNQNEADWRFFLGKGTVFGVRGSDGHLVATAALLPYTVRQRLDQHGAGDREPAPPRTCDQTGRCVSGCRDEAGLCHLARCDAGGRWGIWPAGICADPAAAAIAA